MAEVRLDGAPADAGARRRGRSAPRHVFLVFEGGGARGLAHVGALHAMEEVASELRPVAFAGTSAGAMVAALAAGGYRASEIFALPPTRWWTLLDLLGLPSATALFGTDGWRRLASFRHLYRHAERHARVHGAFGLAGLAALTTLGPWAVVGGVVGLGVTSFREFRSAARGATSLASVRQAFHEALREKGAGRGPDGAVTFADLEERRRSLKICATNITRRRLELFSSETSPLLPVADAVAASICFPGAFQPWRIGEELFLDGGMLSNLPAWPFDEERRINPDALTIAFATVDPPQPSGTMPAAPTPEAWVGAGLRTLLFGGESLSTRGAGQIEILRIPTALDVFDFDIDRVRALREVLEARAAARGALSRQVLDAPQDMRARCVDAQEIIHRTFASIPRAFNGDIETARIRVALALPEDHIHGGMIPVSDPPRPVHSLTLRFGAGFDGAADEGLVLPLRYRGRDTRTVIAQAWRENQPVFGTIGDVTAGFRAPFNRRRRSLISRDLAWVYCLPVTLPGQQTDPVTLGSYLDDKSLAKGPQSTMIQAILVADGNVPIADDPGVVSLLSGALELIAKEITPIFAIERE